MQKKLYLALSLAIFCCWTESSPVNLGTLEFDNLDTGLSNLKYEVEEEDLDDFSKLLDEADNSKNVNDKSKSNVKTNGFKKKNTANIGVKGNHNVQDLKKFYKAARAHDEGDYDDDDVYAIAEALAGESIGVKGNENRKYRKGTKTRGFHRVHHKDEYKKDKEFYEDDETNGTIKKVGGKAIGYKIGTGAGLHKGHFHHDRRKGIYGKKGYADKGFFDKEFSGFSDSQGFEGSFNNES
ncbi:uncharacterized protein LOC128201959 [Galleria mellonella]|uniref:Uncharacterized protein LOC128201959 n=1 Tax=Galleria mellonella TaxID=7137 RepID=A0ABM3MYQ9_GALME|nr:uncharacterized protein LOC128201959 [Galleria mellonella]